MTVFNIEGIPQRRYKFEYPCVNTTDCHPLELHFNKGTYRIELWGAGYTRGGGYTSGEIHFYAKTKLFLFIGGIGERENHLIGMGGYNGGGTSLIIGKYNGHYRQKGGDGATDIRTVKGELRSRLMVAAGAGGGSFSMKGGHGGGLIGGDGNADVNGTFGRGGNQTHGGLGFYSGELGKGATCNTGISTDLAGCGGGGYYGGGSGYHGDLKASGGGGSSFINGHPGCTLNNSLMVLHNTRMIPGNESMPTMNGVYGMGPFGNGFAKITCSDPLLTCKQSFYYSRHVLSMILILINS
jgi:hypothetical protein